MDVEDETENRKKLDEDRKKLQVEFREVEKLSYIPMEVQENLKNDLQQQLQDVEQRRHDLMPEHQKVQNRSQKTHSIQDKRKNMQKGNAAAQEETLKIREDSNGERFRQLSDKVDRNKMPDAEMAAELQRLQAGEERRGSNASQHVIVAGRPSWNSASFWEWIRQGQSSICCARCSSRNSMPVSLLRKGRRNNGDGQEQGRASQQLVLPAPGGINEGTPVRSLELDLPRVRGAHGEGGGAGKSGTLGDRKRGQPNSPSRRPTEEDMHSQETCECKGDEGAFWEEQQ